MILHRQQNTRCQQSVNRLLAESHLGFISNPVNINQGEDEARTGNVQILAQPINIVWNRDASIFAASKDSAWLSLVLSYAGSPSR
mmetsp:Transcript_1075/g.1064  ORF Transcript_1075/g.1064 Transcript_1075/m.1064 type:complete len:85 (+) Transcript_1075:370-624(+)